MGAGSTLLLWCTWPSPCTSPQARGNLSLSGVVRRVHPHTQLSLTFSAVGWRLARWWGRHETILEKRLTCGEGQAGCHHAALEGGHAGRVPGLQLAARGGGAGWRLAPRRLGMPGRPRWVHWGPRQGGPMNGPSTGHQDTTPHQARIDSEPSPGAPRVPYLNAHFHFEMYGLRTIM